MRPSNPALASSSLAPTSFVAPSQYYKLGGVHGVTGGRFADSTYEGPTLSDTINSRVVGSRFQERDSMLYDKLPLASHVAVNESGQLVPSVSTSYPSSPLVPDPRRFGPNHSLIGSEGEPQDGLEPLEEEDWVDLTEETSPDMESDFNGSPPSTRRHQRVEGTSSIKRETFPFRKRILDPSEVSPPHLRLQASRPFVRPLDTIDYDRLGDVYTDIQQWRTKLKAINAEIADVQQDAYNDIADGAKIKGWLMVGKGLHHLPGIQLIEGRSKDDVRWDVLQNERTPLDSAVMWAVVGIAAILLAAGRMRITFELAN